MENPFSAAGPSTPANSHNFATFRRSSPGSSIGVSSKNARPANPSGWQRAQPRVPQNPRKCLFANLPLPDILVPVHSPAQRNLRIIHMDHRHIVQPNGPVDLPDGVRQPFFASNVISRRKQVRRIQACPRMQIPQSAQNLRHFFQPRPHRRAHPRRIFNQNPQFPNGTRRAACFTLSTIVAIACSIDDSPRAPGCTTRKSAPSTTPRTNSS